MEDAAEKLPGCVCFWTCLGISFVFHVTVFEIGEVKHH